MYVTMGATGVREKGEIAHRPGLPGDRRGATDEVTQEFEVVSSAPGDEGGAVDATRGEGSLQGDKGQAAERAAHKVHDAIANLLEDSSWDAVAVQKVVASGLHKSLG